MTNAEALDSVESWRRARVASVGGSSNSQTDHHQQQQQQPPHPTPTTPTPTHHALDANDSACDSLAATNLAPTDDPFLEVLATPPSLASPADSDADSSAYADGPAAGGGSSSSAPPPPHLSPGQKLAARARTLSRELSRASLTTRIAPVREAVKRKAETAREAVKRQTKVAITNARRERSITNFQFYLLLCCALLLLSGVVLWLAWHLFRLIAQSAMRASLYWSSNYDEFHRWTYLVCSEPWQRETVLCQAAGGSWLARELIRAKLAKTDADHCDPLGKGAGCRFEPCPTRGLSNVLFNLADGWRSPLNNPFHALYLVLRPVRPKTRTLLRRVAAGELSLSSLDRILADFPWGERLDGESWFDRSLKSGTSRLKQSLMTSLVYPEMRKWGVVIGGAQTPPAPQCDAVIAPPPDLDGGPMVEGVRNQLLDAVSAGLLSAARVAGRSRRVVRLGRWAGGHAVHSMGRALSSIDYGTITDHSLWALTP